MAEAFQGSELAPVQLPILTRPSDSVGLWPQFPQEPAESSIISVQTATVPARKPIPRKPVSRKPVPRKPLHTAQQGVKQLPEPTASSLPSGPPSPTIITLPLASEHSTPPAPIVLPVHATLPAQPILSPRSGHSGLSPISNRCTFPTQSNNVDPQLPVLRVDDYFAIPTQRAPVASPTVDISSSVTSSPSTVFSPIFSLASLTSDASITTVPSRESRLDYPRLKKPIAIPSLLNHASPFIIGVPFHRCYPKILGEFGVSHDAFLAFLDELNIMQAGHVAFEYTRDAGKAIHLAGNLDPTGITKFVGLGVELSADLGQLAYMKGPLSKKQSVLKKENSTTFHPRGLHVSIMSCKRLRKELKLDPTHPLTAPLMSHWTVPTKDELKAGKRAKCRTLGRIIYQLQDHVHDLELAREANDNWKIEQNTFARRKVAQGVRNFQVSSEIQHELCRGKALQFHIQAEAATDPKQKKKLQRKAAVRDKEAQHIEKVLWLVIRNLYPDPTTMVPIVDGDDEEL